MSEDKNIPIHDSSFDERSCGLAGGMSFHGLEDVLRRAGFVKDNEQVRGFRVNDQGLNYFIEKKNNG